MREILFRSAFYDNNGKFSHFGYWGNIDHKDEFNDSCFKSPSSCSGLTRKCEEQFTGLTDKNGKRIFEGDYIKCHGGLRLEKYPDSGIIVYNVTSFAMRAKTEDGSPWHFSINFSDGTEIEVIGNIHDNPELLNQQS